MSNTEDTITLKFSTGSINGAAGVIQGLISDAHKLNPSIASGLALAKVTVIVSTGGQVPILFG